MFDALGFGGLGFLFPPWSRGRGRLHGRRRSHLPTLYDRPCKVEAINIERINLPTSHTLLAPTSILIRIAVRDQHASPPLPFDSQPRATRTQSLPLHTWSKHAAALRAKCVQATVLFHSYSDIGSRNQAPKLRTCTSSSEKQQKQQGAYNNLCLCFLPTPRL